MGTFMKGRLTWNSRHRNGFLGFSLCGFPKDLGERGKAHLIIGYVLYQNTAKMNIGE